MRAHILLVAMTACLWGQAPLAVHTKNRGVLEDSLDISGGALRVQATPIGKFTSRLLHSVDVYALRCVSSTKGNLKGVRIQLLSTNAKISGTVYLDFDELPVLARTLAEAANGENGESFFVSRGGFKVGRFFFVTDLASGYQRESLQDEMITLNPEQFAKFQILITKAIDELSK